MCYKVRAPLLLTGITMVCSSHLYLHYIYIHIRFYPKRLTNEDNGSNQNQQKSNDMQVL